MHISLSYLSVYLLSVWQALALLTRETLIRPAKKHGILYLFLYHAINWNTYVTRCCTYMYFPYCFAVVFSWNLFIYSILFLAKCDYFFLLLGAVLLPERLLVAPQLLQVAPQHLQHRSHHKQSLLLKGNVNEIFNLWFYMIGLLPGPFPPDCFFEFDFQVVCCCFYRGVTSPSNSKRWSKLYLAVSRFSRTVTFIAQSRCSSYRLYCK